MRQRERLVIARELKATVPQDMQPVEARLLTIACNGCDARVSLDFDDPQLPYGWVSCDAGDFCPACRTTLPVN